MLKTLLFPVPALWRTARRVIAPTSPPVSQRLFTFTDSCQGVVTSHQAQWLSDTHSTGRVGYINQHTGLMVLPGVRTMQIHEQEFWIDGLHRYTLTNRTDIGLTEGQRVSLLADRGRIIYVLTAYPNNPAAR